MRTFNRMNLYQHFSFFLLSLCSLVLKKLVMANLQAARFLGEKIDDGSADLRLSRNKWQVVRILGMSIRIDPLSTGWREMESPWNDVAQRNLCLKQAVVVQKLEAIRSTTDLLTTVVSLNQ
jgi:hypothetical protein